MDNSDILNKPRDPFSEKPESLKEIPANDNELWYKEHDMLREELNSMKKAQTWLINGSVATTGILLQMTRYAKATEFVYLLPLIVLFPAWCLFFDKAISIHRIVGYLKVLEKIIVNPKLAKSVIGWENALVIFRGRQQLKIQRLEKRKKKISSEHKSIYPQKSIRFLSICHWTFFLLTSICLCVSSVVVLKKYFLYQTPEAVLPNNYFYNPIPPAPNVWVGAGILGLLLLIAGFTIRFFCRNETHLKYLSWGRYSYRTNEFLWKQILLKEMILEPERLLEYGNDGRKIKNSDLSCILKGLFQKSNRNYLLKELNHRSFSFKKSDSFNNTFKLLPRKISEEQKKQIRSVLYQKFLPWRSKVLNFEGHNLDFSDYKTLSIRLNIDSGAEETHQNAKVKFQLLNNLESNEVNSTNGLCKNTYDITTSLCEFKIPLSDFKNNHGPIHLDKIYRLAIHYGQYAFGEEINDSNDLKINVDSMTLLT